MYSLVSPSMKGWRYARGRGRVGGGMGHAGLVVTWGMQGWWWHGACRVGGSMGHAGLVVVWGMQG